MKKYEQPDFSIQNALYLFSMLHVITFYASQFWRKMLWKLSVYTIHPPTVHVGITFQPSRPLSCPKKWRKISMLKIGEKEKWRNKGMNKSSSLIPVYTIRLPTVHVCTKFQSSRPHSSWEKCDEKFQCWKLERKKNEEITGLINTSSLILVYMIHLSTVHVCNDFQYSRPHSSREKWQKISMLKIVEKEKWRNKGTNKSSSLIPVYMIHLPTVHVCTNFQSSTPHSSREKGDEKF